KRTGGLDVGWGGLVLWWHAAHRISDARIDEREPIVRCCQVAAAGKAETFERVVEEAAGEVAGKRPPGAVRASQTGGQTHDQQPRTARAERGDRRIEPLRTRPPPLLAHSCAARGVPADPSRA